MSDRDSFSEYDDKYPAEKVWRFTKPVQTATTFSFNGKEILRISEDGFWVRGVKVPQGEYEAKAVYDAFLALVNGRVK